ncbi:MAG: hypothetical protein HS117_10665 [Verrucomicrobiaceae bacterium]|nr:hypothetical protein [Verrucomicrobiaceae bacterium]
MSVLHSPQLSPSHATSDLAAQLEGMLRELNHARNTLVTQIDAQIARANGLLRHVQEIAPPRHLPAPPPAIPGIMQTPPKLTSVVLASPEQPGLDPELEQATLAELNEALALAFTEIASRGGMLPA